MPWQTSTIGEQEVHQVLELFFESFGHPMSAAQWHWKYLQKRADTLERPSFAVGVWDQNHNLVAHAGALIFTGWQPAQTVPRQTVYPHRIAEESGHPRQESGHTRLMIQIVDVMVKPEARGARPGGLVYKVLMDRLRSCLADCFPNALVYGFPGVRPFKLGEQLGFYQRQQNYHLVPLSESVKRRSLLTGLLIEPADWRVGLNEVSAWWRDSVQYQDVAMICRDQHYWEWRFMAHPHVSYQLWRVKARVPWRRQAMAWFVTRSWSKNSHVLVDFVFRDGGRELEEKQACLDALAQMIGQGCSLYGWRVSAKTFPDTVVAMCFITSPQVKASDARVSMGKASFAEEPEPGNRLLFLPADTDVY